MGEKMKHHEQIEKIRSSFTKISRFISQLMREQLTSSPVTLQQCYTLESLQKGPKSMKGLAGEVALHQSTLTRIVEKLEKQSLLTRTRKVDNQRSVEVNITEEGKILYEYLVAENNKLIENLIELVPPKKRDMVTESLEILADILSHDNKNFRDILKNCCKESCCGGIKK
jgi:DNA-binding MarR family transcriptional regulator